MSLERRLEALEARLRSSEPPVTWAEARAADERFHGRVRRKLIAILTGAAPPVEDAALVAADEAIMARWMRQRGMAPDPPLSDEERARLDAKHLTLLERVDVLSDGTRVSFLDKLRCEEAGRRWWLPGWPPKRDAYPHGC
jgi:hypothetical protein